MPNPACQIYLITPPALDPDTFRDGLVAAIESDVVGAVQLRLKQASDDEIRRATEVLLPVVQDRGISFILNDRPDLAHELGCDGVHVGQDDTPYRDAQRIMGTEAVVGVTCKASRHLAITAADQGADYVAFGAFFQSATKADAVTCATTEILQWWSELMVVPCAAIGGISQQNCGPLVAAGVDFLAVISAVWDHPKGPGEAISEFENIIAEYTP